MFETTNQLYMYHEKWGFNPSKNRGKWWFDSETIAIADLW